MGISDDRLTELDAALADLGVDEAEVSAVLRRHECSDSPDLTSTDAELETLAENIEIPRIESPAVLDPAETETRVEEAHALYGDDWDNDKTEVEIVDAADDFVLLVEEGDLEEFESATNEAPNVSVPPPLPTKVVDGDAEDVELDDEEDEGFFRKLFGTRRSSNRP